MSKLVAAPGEPGDRYDRFRDLERLYSDSGIPQNREASGTQSNIKSFKRPEFHKTFTRPDLIKILVSLSNGIQKVFEKEGIGTRTTISNTTKTLSARSLLQRLEPSTTSIEIKTLLSQLVDSVYTDHLAKTEESIANKKSRDPQKDGKTTFKDCARFTVKLQQPILNLDQIPKLLFKIRDTLCDPGTSQLRMVDLKYKIKANVYNDISLYFCIVIGGKPIIIEIQINTEACMEVKRNETVLYDQIKNLCINIPFENHTLLGTNEQVLNFDQRSKIDTDLVYTFFRSLKDDNTPQGDIVQSIAYFLSNLNQESAKLVERYAGIFLKNNQIPNFKVQAPSTDLINHFIEMQKVFEQSYGQYINTNPVLSDTKQIRTLTEMTQGLLQLPYFLEPKDEVSGFETSDLHPDIITNITTSLENSFNLPVYSEQTQA